MRNATLILAALILVPAGACKKKGDKLEAGHERATPRAMGPDAMQADAMRPAPRRAAGPDAFAHMNKVIAHQKVMVKFVQNLKTPADLKKRRAAYVKLNIENMKLQLEAMKLALKLSDAKFKAYVAKADRITAANKHLAVQLAKHQANFMQQPGAKPIAESVQKEIMEKSKTLLQELSKYGTEFMNRKAKLTGGAKKPGGGHAPMEAMQ